MMGVEGVRKELPHFLGYFCKIPNIFAVNCPKSSKAPKSVLTNPPNNVVLPSLHVYILYIVGMCIVLELRGTHAQIYNFKQKMPIDSQNDVTSDVRLSIDSQTDVKYNVRLFKMRRGIFFV